MVHSYAARFLLLAVPQLSCQHCVVSCLSITRTSSTDISLPESWFPRKQKGISSNIRKNVSLDPAQWPLLLARPAASGRHTTRVPGCAECMRWGEERGEWRVARRVPTPRAAPMCCSPAQRVAGGHGDRWCRRVTAATGSGAAEQQLMQAFFCLYAGAPAFCQPHAAADNERSARSRDVYVGPRVTRLLSLTPHMHASMLMRPSFCV